MVVCLQKPSQNIIYIVLHKLQIQTHRGKGKDAQTRFKVLFGLAYRFFDYRWAYGWDFVAGKKINHADSIFFAGPGFLTPLALRSE